jgi:hypothetical protein
MNKKYYFILTFLILPLAANAQFERGRGLLSASGNISFNQFNTGANGISDNILTFNLDGRAGIFFRRGFLVGLFLNSAYYTNYIGSDTRIYGYSVIGGPLVRYYFRNGLFMSFEGGIGTGREHFQLNQFQNNQERRSDLFYGTAGLGYALMIGNNVAFEPMLQFDGLQNINPEDMQDVVNRFRIRLSIGITVFF